MTFMKNMRIIWIILKSSDYTFQNIYTGKMLNALTTPIGTENFWKEVLLDEKE